MSSLVYFIGNWGRVPAAEDDRPNPGTILLGLPLALAVMGGPAMANCVTTGLTTACDASAPNPFTSRIGSGPAEPGGRAVTIGSGSTIQVGNSQAISLGTNATITVQGGAIVRNAATSQGNGGYNGGHNTVEFGGGSTLIVQQGGLILSAGTHVGGEAVNIFGSGSTIMNSGMIRAVNAGAIWATTATGPSTIINTETGVIRSPINLLGAGLQPVDLTNRGRLEGNLNFGSGNDAFRIFAGSVLTGTLNGRAGFDQLFLSGTGSDTISGNFPGFELLTKNDSGTWTITGTITGPTGVIVDAGTLIITGDNSAYAGSVTVNAAGTLQGRAQVLPQAITDNGLVRFAQTDDGTYTGLITGTGWVEKTGAGVLVLAPAAAGGNTYSGGTTITEGTLAIARDAAIGTATAALVFNGGTLRYDAAFDLAATRAISITAAGGTIDTNGVTTTIAQGITGPGALTVDGPGNLILTGANTYAGGTTINAGARVQLGAGGTTGSVTGNVLNNGTLAFNRSDIAIFAGVISGSGAVRQEGTGTTILTGENTYTGGTTITQGTLQLGNGGTTGSIIGNVLNNSLHSLVFNRSNTLVFDGVISGTGAVRQEGTGTTVLTGANTYSGPTSVNAGVLQAGATNTFSPASAVTVAAGATLDLAGFDQTVAGLTNAGLVTLRGAPGTRLTVAGNYVGNGGVVALNTVLGGDNSASDRLVISGGTATGDTRLLVTNRGGAGTLTLGDGIRVVEATNGGTTAGNAFRLGARATAGAYEYFLFRGGYSGGSAEDWFLRNTLPETPVASPGAGEPSVPVPELIPIYRPEVALYTPVPAVGRMLGLATLGRLGSLHERVGELENIRDQEGRSPYANGAWARAFGERSRSRWDGTVEVRATANLIGLQAGFDILRTASYGGGHRDHLGVYVAYADYNAPGVSGLALGQRDLSVGRLLMSGPAVGAYWTHFGPSGWYVDAVLQANWFEVSARSDYGAGLKTNGHGYAASLEAGYPIRFGANWQIEPQAQLVWQGVSVDRTQDAFSPVDWDEGDAVTGRIGARLQYAGRSAEALWQPYAKLNLWHAFAGTDRTSFGSSATVENRYGNTAIEIGAGITARVTRTMSLYAHADYRWSVAGRARETATQGAIGIRFNW